MIVLVLLVSTQVIESAGGRGEVCSADEPCGPGLCCVNNYTKTATVCKELTKKGKLCANDALLTIRNFCPCEPNLTCAKVAGKSLPTYLGICQ